MIALSVMWNFLAGDLGAAFWMWQQTDAEFVLE